MPIIKFKYCDDCLSGHIYGLSSSFWLIRFYIEKTNVFFCFVKSSSPFWSWKIKFDNQVWQKISKVD